MIRVRNVSKSFGSQRVLTDVSLDIDVGTTLAIVGPSGVGKSVLLKLIMGMLDVDEGTIEIFGHEMTSTSSEEEKNLIRADLGVLFQSAALFDSFTVYDNIAFPLRSRTFGAPISEKEIRDRVLEVMESLSLVEYAWNFPEEISLGVRKRVGLARAFITEPKVVLFDEPNTGLDPLVGQEVYDLILSSKKEWGFTGVVISHEIPEVFQVSDRVAMLFNGRLAALGTPEELCSSEDPYVRQFLEGSTHGPIRIH